MEAKERGSKHVRTQRENRRLVVAFAPAKKKDSTNTGIAKERKEKKRKEKKKR